MSLVPMMGGYQGPTGPVLTAEEDSDLEGYADTFTSVNIYGGTAAFGSMTDYTATGGGTITGLLWSPLDSDNLLSVTDDNTGVSNVVIDGTSYAATFLFTGVGYDIYSFSTGTQRIFTGNDYEIGLT
jgi:hypothetical protein